MSTVTDASPADVEPLPRWSTSDVFESLDSAAFRAAMERVSADVARLTAVFEEHGIRATAPRPVTDADGLAADAAIGAYNRTADQLDIVGATVYATVTTDSRDERASSLLSQLEIDDAAMRPLLARLADWVHALGPEQLAAVSEQARDHLEPLRRLSERSAHQMNEAEEGLYAELQTTGSSAWYRLHQDVTSQLATDVEFPDGRTERLPMPAVRGLATSADPAVREAAYRAELAAWPTVATPIAAPSTRSRVRRTPSTVGDTGRARSTPRCTPTASAVPPSTRCTLPSWTHCPTSGAGYGPRPASTATRADCAGRT
jgi:oligoendopeptidase F